MAKTKKGGMHGGGNKKLKGRTSISGASQYDSPRASKPNVPQEVRRDANRPVTAGGGKHRGDRRDMSPTYTGNKTHRSRAGHPRPDVSTRKR